MASRVLEDERSTYRDGCWLVDLAAVPGPALVATTVAGVLGLHVDVESGHSAGTSGLVADFVADREALLVLDGCEHVREAAADLVHRLRLESPRLRILVTSRQRLGISGEVVLRVPPLTLPDPGADMTPEGLPQFEAVSLFVDRAMLAGPDFRLSSTNARAVAEVCVALEGNPLALELAAARIESLTPHTMLTQLADRYRLLSRGPRDVPERHRSLEACVHWDFDLCTPQEQALWSRLSVFAGGCDLETATAVCAGDGVDPDHILDLLSALVEKSVVVTEEGSDGGTRYTLPESLAEFGRQQLRREGQLDLWRGRHLDRCAEPRGRVPAAVGGRPAGRAAASGAHGARQHPGGVGVLRRGWRLGPGRTGLRIATDLDTFWVTAGMAQEARHWLETALASGAGSPADRALAMVLLARFCGFSTTSPGRAWAAQAAAIAGDSDDRAHGLLGVFGAMIAAWDGDAEAWSSRRNSPCDS